MNTSTNLIQPIHLPYRWRGVEKLIINPHGLLSPYWLSNYSLNSRLKSSGEGVDLSAGTTLVYDNNGNLTSYGSKTYTWDYRNRLASSTQLGMATTYSYDHTEQRVKKTTGANSTIYPNRYYEITGATTTKYIFANDELIATVNDGSLTYIHPDHLGSTNVTTNSLGYVAKVLDYYPYGSERMATGTPEVSRTFIGQYSDDESDLSYLNVTPLLRTRI